MIGVFFVLGETTFCHGNIMTPKETMVLIDEDAMTLGIERENIFSSRCHLQFTERWDFCEWIRNK
jgi:hypothetical protein